MKNQLGIDMAALVAAGMVKFPEPSGGSGMLKSKNPRFVPYAERKARHVCRECCRPAAQYKDGSYYLTCDDCNRMARLIDRKGGYK